MTLSPFTFTSRSPGDKGGITCESRVSTRVQYTPVLSMNGSKRRGTSPASGFKNSNPIKRGVSPRGVLHKVTDRFTCAKPCPMGGATVLHILHKDGVHGLQAVPG